MTWLIGGNDYVDAVQEKFLSLMDIIEDNGHQIDFEIIDYENEYDLNVDVYVDENLAGRAKTLGEIGHVVDGYLESDEVYN